VVVAVDGEGVGEVPGAEVGGAKAGELTLEAPKRGILGTVGAVGHDGGDHGQVGPAGGVAGGGPPRQLLGGQPPGGQCLERAGSGLPSL
jgi:hypothetical protein